MPWLSRLRRAEKETAERRPDIATKLSVLAAQQYEVAQQLKGIVKEMQQERKAHHA
jgi:hypothetical protein